MRLTTSQQQITREATLKRFGVSACLFGSRVDDAKRGGDIDLYIEARLSPEDAFKCETRLAADLYLKLGERKIDIVVNTGTLDRRFTRSLVRKGSGCEFVLRCSIAAM